MKPEFVLLNSYYKQLYANVDANQEFLAKVRTHIELCEDIAEADREESMRTLTTEYDRERSVIVKAKHWWAERAKPFGMTMTPKLLPAASSKSAVPIEKKYTALDRRFLRSLRITADEPPKDEDDGA